MKYEPSIDRVRLLETVRTAYGFPVEALTFVPVGFVAVCYMAQCSDGARYFLKLWPDTYGGIAQAARRSTVLRLTRALHQQQLYPRVLYPLLTRSGALEATFADMPFALFPFLTGHAPPQKWPVALQDEWARTFATLHRATPALVDVLPPREIFDIPFEADLLRGLATFTKTGASARPGVLALRDLLLPRQAEILAQLARLQRLQQIVRQLPSPFVLCHTDMGGDNLLVNEQGQFSVLDWDDATLAPPEYDLHEARWTDIARVLERYAVAGGAHPLHLDHFAFALLRRFLDDMTARLRNILDANTSIDQDTDDLNGIVAWGFAQWAALDATLDEIAAALGHRQV